MLSPELSAKIAVWRQKARDNTLTREEQREVIIALREGRVTASAVSAKSRAKKAPIDVAALEKELEGLQ